MSGKPVFVPVTKAKAERLPEDSLSSVEEGKAGFASDERKSPETVITIPKTKKEVEEEAKKLEKEKGVERLSKILPPGLAQEVKAAKKAGKRSKSRKSRKTLRRKTRKVRK